MEMKIKLFGCALLKTVHVFCAVAVSFLWLSVNRDARIRMEKAPRAALDRGRNVDLLRDVWWCCGY